MLKFLWVLCNPSLLDVMPSVVLITGETYLCTTAAIEECFAKVGQRGWQPGTLETLFSSGKTYSSAASGYQGPTASRSNSTGGSQVFFLNESCLLLFLSRSCLGLWRALDWCAAMHPKGTAPDFCFFLLLLGNERSYQEIPYWQACQSNISLPSSVCFNFLGWNVAMVFSCSGENCECQAGSGPPSRGSATEADQRAAWIFLHQLMLRCCGCGCGSVPKHCSA